MSNSKQENELIQVIKSINQSWLKGKTGDIAGFLHKDIVTTDSLLNVLIKGKDDCIKSYDDFNADAKTHRYKEKDFIVNTFGATATVQYTFEISYTMHCKEYNETGKDYYVLTNEKGKWLVVWRIMFA